MLDMTVDLGPSRNLPGSDNPCAISQSISDVFVFILNYGSSSVMILYPESLSWSPEAYFPDVSSINNLSLSKGMNKPKASRFMLDDINPVVVIPIIHP